MDASIGPPCLPTTPTTDPDIEKIKQKLIRGGVAPTPKIIHTIRKKELQKLNRRLAKHPLPLLTDSQKQALAQDSYFRTIKSEYRNLTKQLNPGEKTVGRPWERPEKLKLRELASETREYSGGNLKMEHLKELSDIMDNEREKLQWLLEDDVEVDEGWLEQETRNVAPPKRCRSEAEAIRFFLERLSSTQLSAKDWKFSRMMKQSGLQFTENQMLKIVAGLGEKGQWKHALSLVEWVYNSKEYKHHRSRFVYTKLLAILGKAGRVREALKVFNFMREDRHIYPDMAAYHSIAVALGQAGRLKELLNIIQFMKEKPKKIKNMRHKNWDPELQPDIVVYNAVLNACVPSRQWKGVSWVFAQLRKGGLTPNGATYGLAMEVVLLLLDCVVLNFIHIYKGLSKYNGKLIG